MGVARPAQKVYTMSYHTSSNTLKVKVHGRNKHLILTHASRFRIEIHPQIYTYGEDKEIIEIKERQM